MVGYNFDKAEHVHTYDGKPLKGASTLVGILAKPLTYWASGLACEKFGWTNSKKQVDGKYTTIPLAQRVEIVRPVLERIKSMNEEQFLALGDEAYKAHATSLKDSAGKGTDMHEELEVYVKECLLADGRPFYKQGHRAVEIFSKWSVENVDKFLYSEAHGYSLRLWIGGISDCGALMKDGKVALIDFKSSKDAYVSQFLQAAVYDTLFIENGIHQDIGTLFQMTSSWTPADVYIIFPFGAENPEPKLRYEVEQLRKGAEALAFVYDIVNNTNFAKE